MANEYKLSHTASQIDAKLTKIDSLAEKSEIPTKLSDLTDDKGYLTAVPDEYITETELSAKGYLTEHQSLADYAKTADLGDLATKDIIDITDLAPEVQTSLGKAEGALQSYTETDPTVPSWAKQTNKPTYTAAEVGALPDTTEIPSTLADLTDDSTHRVVTDAEKSAWNAKSDSDHTHSTDEIDSNTSFSYISSGTLTDMLTSVDEVFAGVQEQLDTKVDAAAVDTSISAHNTSTTAHTDIREEISQLSSEKVDKTSMTLGVHVDGFVYLFVNGSPQGNGLDIKADVIEGDVFGYVDENNNIVLNGELADGTYSVKYEMENGSTVSIGNLVLDTNVYYSVTNTLTNCKNSNSATQVVEGNSYSATITANDGYELKTVTVTMGGSAVSVSGGVINIASVTGDIVITAVAEEVVGEVRTNFCVPLGDGWISGGRCSSAGADREDSEAYALTNYIAVQNGDMVYVENLVISTSTYSGLYKTDKTAIGGFVFPSSGAKTSYVKDVSMTSNGGQFIVDNANAGYIRICGTPYNVIDNTASTFEQKYDVNNLGIVINIKRNGEWL